LEKLFNYREYLVILKKYQLPSNLEKLAVPATAHVDNEMIDTNDIMGIVIFEMFMIPQLSV
jgi:hypothetical protein